MSQTKVSLVHVASSHEMGLTNQETQLALAYKAFSDINITVVSGENEQVHGSFNKLATAGIPVNIINGFDIHKDLLRLINEFSVICQKQRANIVTVNTNWQLLIAGLAKITSHNNYKIIYTIHGFRNNEPVKSLIARVLIGLLLFLLADAINAPSSYVRRKFSFLGYKMKSIPLGEDDSFFLNTSLPDFNSPLRLCFPGQFRKGKNQDMLIRAFADYISKSNDNVTKLVLCGDGELLPAAKALANDLNISEQVIFTGQLNREEMLKIYKDCQIAVIPTNSETFGHCIAEPLVMQRIVLSRPVGIAPDYIEHGKNGFIFGSHKDLVELMLSLKSIDKNELIRIAETAGKTGQLFNWKNVARQNISLLMQPLLNHKGKN